jgi:hypothetical protein
MRSLHQRVRPLCAFDEAHDHEQQNCPKGCNDDATYQSAAKKLSEQQPAEKRAYDADYEIADETKPSTLDENASQPACHHTNNEKPDKSHFESPVSGQGGHCRTKRSSLAACAGPFLEYAQGAYLRRFAGGNAMFAEAVRRLLAAACIATLSPLGWAIDLNGPSNPRSNQDCNTFAFRVLAAIHLEFSQSRAKCEELWEAGGTATQPRLNQCYREAADKKASLEDALNRERTGCAEKVTDL